MNKDFIVPVGKIIKEYLDEYNVSQKELAARLGMSEKHISNLLSGKSRLTEEVAINLESIIKNVPATYWLNLESKYREYIAREEMYQRIVNNDLEMISKRFHFKEVFGGMDWSIEKQALEMLKLLGISDFDNFSKTYSNLAINFMEDGGKEEAIVIWLKLCEEEVEIQNNNLDDIEFKLANLKKKLYLFKRLAESEQIEAISKDCLKLCNRLGIYLVIYPAITNCKVRGALTTINSHPAIFLSGRFKTHDHMWFAFLHEIGHLLYHYDKKETILSFEDDKGIKEEEANEFARDLLIDSSEYQIYVDDGVFSERSVRNFAIKQRTHPGIVVARLQHDNHLKMSELNFLKAKIQL